MERLTRAVLLCGVFALILVAYQKHFQNVIEQAAAKGVVADTLGILSSEDRIWLIEQADGLRRRFGLELAVRLGGKPLAPAPDDPKMVFVYFDPDCQNSRVLLPPLTASALPRGLADDLGRDHLDAACRDGRVREGLLATVGLLIDSLGEAAGRGKGETHE
ncbi:MAG: TPM domain-containing protein [Solidesulfovibrio sp.]